MIFLLFWGWGGFFFEKTLPITVLKYNLQLSPSKVCTNLCTYDKIIEATPTINR